jgi:hypothetical protein
MPLQDAGVAELVDALDLGSSDASRGGSSPFARTNIVLAPKQRGLTVSYSHFWVRCQ